MPRKTTHVVPDSKGGWNVKQGGAGRATKNFDTQQQAIEYGRGLSVRQGSEFIIHRPDGRIRQCDSHGGDPCPPKDKN
ncbi:MAG: DUF2188 domain-containing protein [Candidatus Cloacimonetes bacterium]|nr:DUF2188 domain-containing protein [Candidatus Cloacimonadota bacterium]